MTGRQQFAASACSALGYKPQSRQERVAKLACDIAFDKWPAAFSAGNTNGWSRREFVRQQRREEREFKRQVKAETKSRIVADPQAYGFDPFTIWFIGLLISGIVSGIIRFLLEQWWSSPSTIQAARLES